MSKQADVTVTNKHPETQKTLAPTPEAREFWDGLGAMARCLQGEHRTVIQSKKDEAAARQFSHTLVHVSGLHAWASRYCLDCGEAVHLSE